MTVKTVAIAAAAVAIIGAGLTLGGAALASDDHGHRGRGEHREEHEEGHEGGEHGRGKEGRRGSAASMDPTYAKECGACHLAYPPSMLPAPAWRGILGGLDRHFGQNAELDDATRARLEGWLASQAGPGSAAEPRLTRTGWFQRKHREVPSGAAARPAVGSMANCAACHPGATGWDFDEHRVRIPR